MFPAFKAPDKCEFQFKIYISVVETPDLSII